MLDRWRRPKPSANRRAGSSHRSCRVNPLRRPFLVRPTASRTRLSGPVRQSTDTSGCSSTGITSQSTGSSACRTAASTRSSGTCGLGKPLSCPRAKGGARVITRKPTPPAPDAGLKHARCPSASSSSTARTSSSADRTRHHGGTGTPIACTAS
ncbi:hypothetical protein ACVW19_006016 [Streptomyces sp. TE5632]